MKTESNESFLKLFNLSYQYLINDLQRIKECHHLNNLIDSAQSESGDDQYYPQFDDAIREEAFKMGYYYQIFYCLERSMRKLIAETIESTEGQNWWNNAHVPENIIINVDLNMKKERDSGFSRRSEDEIDYTNFGELGEIIKKNWTIFGSIFNSQRALEKVIFNLNTIRNNIAHCSPLADDEILRLKLSVRDWFRLME